MQDRSKGLILGSIVGSIGGLIVGGALSALFWNDLAAGIRKIVRRITKQGNEINFEILLQ